MNFGSFFVAFLLVGLSEWGDKTFFALFVLSGRFRTPLSLWVGAMAGYVVLGTLAVTFGRSILLFVPHNLLTFLAGIVFLFLGGWIFFGKEEREGSIQKKEGAFLTGFFLILTAEFLDKSQIAMATLAARFEGFFFIFLGSLLGVGLVDGLAIWVGSRMASHFNFSLWKKGGGLLFFFLGIFSIVCAFR